MILPTILLAAAAAWHADPVIVASAVDIGAGLDQQPDRLQIAMCCREMQRRGVVRKVATVKIGTACSQEAAGGMLVAHSRQVQRRGWSNWTRSRRTTGRWHNCLPTAAGDRCSA